MDLKDKVIVVTGGAKGIGRALCLRFAAADPRGIVVGDMDVAHAQEVAREVNGVAVETNVAVEDDVRRLAARAVERYGPVDLFCSNAGIHHPGGFEVPDADWERIWSVNVKAHIYAARAVVPAMLERGRGYLLHTVSAAGLLTQIGSAPYSVTKHAALAFAEWLSITYGDRGLKVSCLCPQGVRTDMLFHTAPDHPSFLVEGALEPETVAEAAVDGLRDERFLILPHPEVAEYFLRKASDYERWLRGMRRLQAKVAGGAT